MKDFKNKYRSHSNRLPGFNYTQGFWYYVTICTKNMVKCFGTIENSKMVFSQSGKIANDIWSELPNHLPVSLDEFVIMPNHIHGIIILENEESMIKSRDLIHQVSEDSEDSQNLENLANSVNKARSKSFMNHGKTKDGDLINQISTKKFNLMKQDNMTLGNVVRFYKAKVTRTIRDQIDANFAWQSNYYDHIIRNEKDLFRIRQYIQNNPLKWEIDKYYS